MISKERYDVLGKKYVISLLKEISAGKINGVIAFERIAAIPGDETTIEEKVVMGSYIGAFIEKMSGRGVLFAATDSITPWKLRICKRTRREYRQG